MSKRKNTLNDLEEFLKLQASTLVPPQPVETSKPIPPPQPIESAKEGNVITPQPVQQTPSFEASKVFDLLEEMKKLASRNKNDFYDHVIKAVESMPNESNEILLINTALYLKHGDNWKAGIEEYGKRRKTSRS
jgi:hypothetical protein